ncbi:hypothetical protein RI367_006581 [Sorochytrium milnesiophthora]
MVVIARLTPMADDQVERLPRYLATCLQNATTVQNAVNAHTLPIVQQADDVEEAGTGICVKTYVRVRPLLQDERDRGLYAAVRTPADGSAVCTLYRPGAFDFPLSGRGVDAHSVVDFGVVNDAAVRAHSFAFEGVFGADTPNSIVYQTIGAQLQGALIAGESATVMAYGQTGSGKTFTMTYLQERLLSELLDDNDGDCVVDMQYYEIQGNKVYDLLNERREGKVRQRADGSIAVMECQQVQCQTAANALQALKAGHNLRSTGTGTDEVHCSAMADDHLAATLKNTLSSRSHAICSLTVTSKQGVTETVGSIKLVDLAGSERVSDTHKHDAARLQETKWSNMSLMALKDCIRVQSDNRGKAAKSRAVVPWRNSRLTTVLREMFDVGSTQQHQRRHHVVFLGLVAPTIADVDHSLNTLRYAASLKPNSGQALQTLTDNRDDAVTRSGIKRSPIWWTAEDVHAWLHAESPAPLDPALLLKNTGPEIFDERWLARGEQSQEYGAGMVLNRMKSQCFIERCMAQGMDLTDACRLQDKVRSLFCRLRSNARTTEKESELCQTLLLERAEQ